MRAASLPLRILSLALAALIWLPSSSSAGVQVPGGTIEKVDFERHIMGLFGRMGCNMGSCHGSFQGKGGFRLSLFGYDPSMDYHAVTHEFAGRRISVNNPDESLLLMKATGQVEHGGAMRFSKESWQYRVFREWMVQGASWNKGSGDVASITITPPEVAFTKTGESAQIQVRARFKDGSELDITPFCDFRTNDDAVAEVSNLGRIKGLRAGTTAIVVSYRGNVLPVRVLVPMELAKEFVYPKVPEVNYIDREIFARLRQLNMVPSDLASDTEFLRRVYIDTIGQLPSPEEVRAFLKDSDPNKRSKKIDELLAHPLHAALWATRFCDITGNDTAALENPVQLKAKRSQMWHDWFRKRIAENMPYDQIVKGVLCATSRDGRSPEEWTKEAIAIESAALKGFDFSDYANRPSLDLFWRRQQKVPIEQWGEKTAAAFLGIRLECAQCHKHPFDRWTQAEYRAYANIFQQVTHGISPQSKKAIDAANAELKKLDTSGKKNQLLTVREVFLASNSKGLPHPDTNEYLPAQAPGGPVIAINSTSDPRVALFEWMRSPDNPFFARSFANRVWGHYFGIGLVHPVDDFSLGNPPSNEKLLDALAKDFIQSGFDIRKLERTILNSRTYQLSSKTNFTNKFDTKNYSHSYVRPMMAEVVVDVLNSALGATENFGPDVRPGSKAIEVGPSQIQQQQLAYVFRIFGRSPRTAACDCERVMDPALPQKLFTMTDVGILAKLNSPTGRLQKLISSKLSDEQVLEELFLATLTRFPTQGEIAWFRQHRAKDRRAALTDVMWALINTREFILNH